MGILSLFNCQDKKIYNTDNDFPKIENQLKMSSKEVDNIYEREFENNFSLKRDESFDEDYKKIIYIKNNLYYIGFASVLDKRGNENPNLKYLVKVNPDTGEISVVK